MTALDEARKVLAKYRTIRYTSGDTQNVPNGIFRELWDDYASALAALLEENKAQAKRLDELKTDLVAVAKQRNEAQTALRRIIVAGNDQAAIAKAALAAEEA